MTLRMDETVAVVTGSHLTADGGIPIGPRHAWDPGSPGPLTEALALSAEQLPAMRENRPD
jgi:hypothetical protein